MFIWGFKKKEKVYMHASLVEWVLLLASDVLSIEVEE